MACVVLEIHNVDSGQDSIIAPKEIVLEIQNINETEETENE